MKRIINITALIFNIIFIVVLLVSGASTLISPEQFVFPAYFGLLLLPLVCINVGFVVFWGIKLKWYAVFSVLAIALVWGNLQNSFPINFSAKNEVAQQDSVPCISLLSYNVKLFNFYQKKKTQENHNEILNYIVGRDADVICLQEFGFYNEKNFLSEDDILSVMNEKYPYHHFSYHKNSKGNSVYGVAVFSKFPIVKKEQIEYFSEYNSTTCSDIEVDGTIIRLFNCHLESNRLSLDDKKQMKELVGEDVNQNKLTQTTGQLGRKLGAAYVKRAFQADVIADEIARSPYPVIVCGDFNDTPVSYTYHRVRGDLTDAFTATSSGLGTTYNEFPFWFRIDYIFHSPQFTAGNFKIDKVKYSDHYPISCDILVNGQR